MLFVDLDGTLLLDNSYHLFLWSVCVCGGLRLRVALFRAVLARALGGRTARLRMKRSMLCAFAQAGAERQKAVVAHTLAMMRRTVSQPVLSRVTEFRALGWLTILATAAPECYARPFAEELGFDDCLASPPVANPADWVEMIGAHKAHACKIWLEAVAAIPNAEIAAIADHRDDLPLLRMANHVVIQAPADEASLIAGELHTDARFEHIDPVSCDDKGGMWLWINDRPAGPFDPWEVKTVLSKHRYALLFQRDARWRRVLPGQSLAGAAIRRECPQPPTARDRMSVATRRLIVRDLFGVFH